MILEGIVTSLSPDGRLNIAPMGPRVDADMKRMIFRPFKTSRTYCNLKAHGEGVFHITDDVLLFAQAAVTELTTLPEVEPASQILGYVLRDTCRFYEFRVIECDDREERTQLLVEVLTGGGRREFLGFNRARNAVIEAAILATRLHILPHEDVLAEYRKLALLVEKTGGSRELEAFRFLEQFVKERITG